MYMCFNSFSVVVLLGSAPGHMLRTGLGFIVVIQSIKGSSVFPLVQKSRVMNVCWCIQVSGLGSFRIQRVKFDE